MVCKRYGALPSAIDKENAMRMLMMTKVASLFQDEPEAIEDFG